MNITNSMRNNNRNIWSRRLAFQAVYSWSINNCDISDLILIFKSDENYVKASEDHDDAVRPRIICEVINEQIHRPFLGFNRAQFSVIELAVLSTRLGRIDDNKIKDEMKYLKIGIDKTAGKNEKEAWEWIEKKINIYFENND